jgi:peptide/nickel transport system permease protein
MQRYIVRRFLLLIPTALLATVIMFTLMKLIPGDVATAILANMEEGAALTQQESEEQEAAIRKRFGLDKPLPIQYLLWLKSVAKGDLGMSVWQFRPVREVILERAPRTLELAVVIIFLIYVQSVPLGIIAALRQDSFVDHAIRLYSIMGLSVPIIWVGTLFLFVFSRYVGWIPPVEWKGFTEDPVHNLIVVTVPAALVAFGGGASVIRLVRNQMLEVIREDYIRTANAKGLTSQVVIVRHALRNALLPVVTHFGSLLGILLLGTVVVETVFHIPGMGKSMVDAIAVRDFPVLQGLVLFNVMLILIINLIVDISYAFIDPRIRYS